jgi:hypothetical protein
MQSVQDQAWAHLGQPGTWLSAAERLAVATETRRARRCELCARRRAALSPYAEIGDHDAESALARDEVDLIHRVTTDPGRLTRDWFDRLDIPDARYVEIVGVAVVTIGMDTFCRGIGAEERMLPDPIPGEPTRERPEASDGVAWVPLRRAWDQPNVARALSLVPEEARVALELAAVEYVPMDRVIDLDHDPKRAISRQQMELIAGRVSALNGCFY